MVKKLMSLVLIVNSLLLIVVSLCLIYAVKENASLQEQLGSVPHDVQIIGWEDDAGGGRWIIKMNNHWEVVPDPSSQER
jgi:hypothetical protein